MSAKRETSERQPRQRKGVVKNNPTDAEIEARRELVSRMVLMRWPQRDIATTLKVSPATISRDVAVVTERWRERANENITEALAREVAQLDEVERRLWNEHLRTSPIDTATVPVLLSVIDRRAKLLGLDKPRRLEVTGADGAPLFGESQDALLDEIDRLGERLASLDSRTTPDA